MLVFSPLPDGTYLGYWGYGLFVFVCAILVPTMKVLTFSNSYYIMNIFTLFLSMLLLAVSIIFIDSQTSNPHYGTMTK
jgi:hypothetical protein